MICDYIGCERCPMAERCCRQSVGRRYDDLYDGYTGTYFADEDLCEELLYESVEDGRAAFYDAWIEYVSEYED